MKFSAKPLFTYIILIALIHFKSEAQVVYEPTYKTVYGYLSRLAQKGVIDLDDIVLPLSRTYISNKLDTLSYQSGILTPLEKKELDFYRKEYTLERNIEQKIDLETPYKSVFKTLSGDRFRWGAYQDKQFTINAQPIGGYAGEINENGKFNHHTWRGIWVHGYLGKNIGYSFDFRDNTERGESIDKIKNFTPTTGVISLNSADDAIEYSELKGTVSASWKWGVFSIGKDYFNWGYGLGGKIVMSQKAPAFPLIRLDLSPVKWFRFNYQHIWLNSDVIDSLTIRSTSIGGANWNQFSYREKLLAMHSLTFIPTKGLSISVGESAIYNDGVKIAYLIPVMFFRAIDHYSGGLRNNGVSNSQVFFQLSSRNLLPKTHFYFTYYIDEIRLKGIFDSSDNRDQTAYTAGISIADFPFNNLSWTAEYSKIRPFAYLNYAPAQDYTSAGYSLGHWIGTNADQFYAEFLLRLVRGFQIKGKFEFIRKGDTGTGYLQQTEIGTPFLWGTVNRFTNLSLSAQYELTHDLYFKAGYTFQTRYGANRGNDYEKQFASIGFNYGF